MSYISYLLFGTIKENLCRSCLNKKYSLDLTRRNCVYELYQQQCLGCKEIKNIVGGIHLHAKLTPRGIKAYRHMVTYVEKEDETQDDFHLKISPTVKYSEEE